MQSHVSLQERQREFWEIITRGGEGDMNMEQGGGQPQARKRQQPLEAERGEESLPLRASGEAQPCLHLDFKYLASGIQL